MAERALGGLGGVLDAAGRYMSPLLVSAPLLRREALSSSRIEGTISTPEELAMLEIQEDDDESPDEDVDSSSASSSHGQEVLNYVRALDHGFKQIEARPFSLWLIRELHEILMSGVRGNEECPGEFRTVQNFIGSSQDIREARFVPPPVVHLQNCLDELEKYIREEEVLPPLVRLAIIHYQFETIHPFRDGNGRVGRLLIPLLLCLYNVISGPVLYVSSFLERRKDAYTDLMLRVSKTGDFHRWILFFLEAVEASALESKERVNTLLSLRTTYHDKLHRTQATAKLGKLVDYMFAQPVVTIKRAARILEVTEVTASSNLKRLQSMGIVVESTGRKRNQRYVAQEIIQVSHG